MTETLGFDQTFLSNPTDLAIPHCDGLVELTYTHFTVLLQPDRRLAAITAVNIDGAQLVSVDRSDEWKLDPRLPSDQQAGPEIYRYNDLDRGHLVRRRDPVWGDPSTATLANIDTFHYTVCTPQTANVNQSHQLWAGLRDNILDHATTYGHD